MRIVLAANPSSGSADDEGLAQSRSVLEGHGTVTLLQPESPDELSERLAGADADLFVVAGGDGTLNLAVNALRARLEEVTLALLPRGTGNDLARTLHIPEDPVESATIAVSGSPLPLDVWRARSAGVDRLFVNACMGGFPVKVNESITEDMKRFLGPAAFWVGGAKAATDIQRYVVLVNGNRTEDCLAVGVGNGRTCGGGIEVWPDADPRDGDLNACVLAAEGMLEAAKLAAKVKGGSHVELEGVESTKADRIQIDSSPQLELNVDGELVGLKTPVVFELFASTRFKVPAK